MTTPETIYFRLLGRPMVDPKSSRVFIYLWSKWTFFVGRGSKWVFSERPMGMFAAVFSAASGVLTVLFRINTLCHCNEWGRNAPVLGLFANQRTYDKYRGSAPGAGLKVEGRSWRRQRKRQRQRQTRRERQRDRDAPEFQLKLALEQFWKEKRNRI